MEQPGIEPKWSWGESNPRPKERIRPADYACRERDRDDGVNNAPSLGADLAGTRFSAFHHLVFIAKRGPGTCFPAIMFPGSPGPSPYAASARAGRALSFAFTYGMR